MFNGFKAKLRYLVPESGMKYQSSGRVMHHIRRDKRVVDALRAAGYQLTRPVITRVLVNMFQIAAPIVAAGRAEGEDLWDILPRAQREIDWAQNLPEPIVFELFVSLIEARCEWEKNPEYPYYKFELYNPAIRELVAFRTTIGDYGTNNVSWVLTDAVFFDELARGLDIDDDEDEDVVMNDGNLGSDNYEGEVEDPMVADIVPPLAQMNIEQGEVEL
ncbi:hypothetical protein EKO27_g7514 [Xylaria grammica]|uniref:Uncharacterized protein n=1 Tax=Xylaria grammica TaxID=363999 RepID=A0A439CZG1_9PEZI|nr:hypothetical protein EKO27_g7514 [Xylaria grammica]